MEEGVVSLSGASKYSATSGIEKPAKGSDPRFFRWRLRDMKSSARSTLTTAACRGRGGSYPPPPRTDPGVRYYRTGLFRLPRFRNTLLNIAPKLSPAVRFALLVGPACPDKVSFTGYGCLSAPSPCERPYRLRVLWADPTPEGSSASLLGLSCPPTCLWVGSGQIPNVPTHDRNPSGIPSS